jgi:hypothetical protein
MRSALPSGFTLKPSITAWLAEANVIDVQMKGWENTLVGSLAVVLEQRP